MLQVEALGVLPRVKLCGCCHFTFCFGPFSSGSLGHLCGHWGTCGTRKPLTGLFCTPRPCHLGSQTWKDGFAWVGNQTWAWFLQPQVAKPSLSISAWMFWTLSRP